jgi:histone H4
LFLLFSPLPSFIFHRNMSGRGKGGKGLSGQGKGKSPAAPANQGGKTLAAVRHRRKQYKDNIKGITKPAIRRLCRRGGVKRIGGLLYEAARTVLRDQFLTALIQKSIAVLGIRKTVTTQDLFLAQHAMNMVMY